MKVTLNKKEIGEVIVEYLKKRGVGVTVDQAFFNTNGLESEIREVSMPLKDGPYR